MANNMNILPNDTLLSNLNDFSGHLGNANNGFGDFISNLGGLVNSVRRIDASLGQNTTGLISGLSELSRSTSNIRRPYQSTDQGSRSFDRPRIPDIGNLFDQAFQHPSFSNNISRNVSNAISSGITRGSGSPSSMSRMSNTLNPVSFVQDAMMFGAVFPAQLKMAEAITQPITGVAEAIEPIKGFAKGFTGLGSAIEGFKSQLASPFDLYEGLYQSQAMLGSALGGEKAADQALKSALKMARDYPVKTEEALGALTKMAVYPEVKPHLTSEKFQNQLMETVSGLSLIAPEQGMKGAMFSMVEAMSGSWRSMQMRFNVSPEVIQSLSGMTKAEMSSDPTKLVEGLHRFIGKAVGLDVLEKQKYTFSKQVDNFGDSLQMVTKEVMERTGLYQTVTGAATAFQTGFSTLGNNKEFLNYTSSIFKPFQAKMDQAVANFMGVGVGAYKSMPMTQVMEALEKNFSGLSMDEIGQKFESLIGDMGGILKDTTLKIDSVISGKFGDVLGLIGGDIASVATSSFSNMAGAIISGIGTSIMDNPMAILGSAASVAIPALGVMGGLQLIPTLLEKGFERGLFGKIGSIMTGGMLGSVSPVTTAARGQVGGTRSSVSNLLAAQRERLDDILTDDISKATRQIESASDAVTTRRGATGASTRMNVINRALDRSMDVSTMSRSNQKAFTDYFKKLKGAGFSESDINKLSNTLRMESIEALENQTYIDRGVRSARRSDISSLRRELSGVTYGYDMSKSTERAIRYTGSKSAYGDAFRVGDEITSGMVSKLSAAAKDYTKIANITSASDLSRVTDAGALQRFAKDLNVSVSDLSRGNISSEQLGLLRQNGRLLRESTENTRGLLEGFRGGQFRGVTDLERRAGQLMPGLDRILNTASTRDTIGRLGTFDYGSLTSPRIADRMTRMLNLNREALSSITVDVPSNLRESLGGRRQLNLMDAINSRQFQRYRTGGIGTLMDMNPQQQQRALMGNVALRALESDPALFSQVTEQMQSGTRRLGALRNISRISSLMRQSSTLRNVGRVAGGLMSFIDPLLVGFQSQDIASELGLSRSQSMGVGLGAGGLLGGGLLGARALMGGAGFASSMGSVAGLGGGLALLTTGLELYRSKVKSDREIREQEASLMSGMGSINFEGVDRSALLKAGGAVSSNEKIRRQAGMKSMMDNAILKSLLIGGGAAAAILSGGTLVPLLGLAAAGMGTALAGSDYFSGKSSATSEAKGLRGLTSGFVGGAEFYNKKINDLNADIAELEYKEMAGGGLTGAEQTKLITTRKLRSDAEKNKNIQQRAINTVANIYGTEDTGFLTTLDDERTSGAYRLSNYLKKARPGTNRVSEYIGTAAVSSQVSQDLNTVMQEGIKEDDFSKVRRSLVKASTINKNMTGRFIETLQDVDFGNKNQVQTVLQSEMGRLNSLVAPLESKRGMDLFKGLNQGSLIQQQMFAKVRSSMSTSKGERNLYSNIEMATGRKLAELGSIDDNVMQINTFKGLASAISNNEKTFKKISDQQAMYGAADLSGLSKGKRTELEYAMKRRESSVGDMKGEGLLSLAREKFGKDIGLSDLSNSQITELMKDDSAKKAFESIKLASSEFEKSSLSLGRTFEATSNSVEKKFAFSVEKASLAVQNFSAGISTSGDFSTKTMGFVNTLKDSIQTMALTGEGKKFGAAAGFEEMRKNQMAKLAFDLADVKSVGDLSRVDEQGLTGIDRLRQMGNLSDEQFGQVSSLRSQFEAGEKDISKSRMLGLKAAEQTAQLAFQASSVGSREFQNVAGSMLGTNLQQRQRLRESSANELNTALKGFESAQTPEEKRKFSTFIDSNIAAQRKLGLNDYQIRAGVSQFAGGDFDAFDRVASKRVDALVSKTNSDVMLSMLSGSDVKTTKDIEGLSPTQKMEYSKLDNLEDRKQYLTDSSGYGYISTRDGKLGFNKGHSEFSGGDIKNILDTVPQTVDANQFDSAVNNFRQASTNQIDSVSKQTEIASATVTSAVIDNEVSQSVTKPQSITIDTQQTDIGDKTLDGAASASNTAALEGLLNKSPVIETPRNEESFTLMP